MSTIAETQISLILDIIHEAMRLYLIRHLDGAISYLQIAMNTLRKPYKKYPLRTPYEKEQYYFYLYKEVIVGYNEYLDEIRAKIKKNLF